MLLVTRGGRWRRRCSRSWDYIEGEHPCLPSIPLTDFDRSPIALKLYGLAVLGLNSLTEFSVFPDLIASRTYNVRGILISRADMVAVMPFLEQVSKILLDSVPTVNRPGVT
jgi:hypothetical protein